MKTFTSLVAAFFLFASLILTGCNGDVFIEDFTPSVGELSLDGNGDTATVRFSGAGWTYLSVSYSIYGDDQYRVRVYDAEGTLVGNEPYSYEGLGKIVFSKDDLWTFTVERTAGDEIKVYTDENASGHELEFIITASNDYEWKYINVRVSPCDAYELRDITYSLDAYYYEEPMEEKWSTTFRNHGDSETGYAVRPFEDEWRNVEFTCDSRGLYQLLEKKPVVEVPTRVDGRLQMTGEQVQYGLASDSSVQPGKLPLSVDRNTERWVDLPPHTATTVTLFVEYERFETTYTIDAVQPKSGKHRTITGTLRSWEAKDYFVGFSTEPLND